jgi:hypothetical protein
MMGRAVLCTGFLIMVQATPEDSDLTELQAHAMSSNDEPVYASSVLRSFRKLQTGGLSGVTSADLPSAFNAGGQLVLGNRYNYIGGDGNLEYSELDFSNPNNLVVNNLGGMGPNFNQRCAIERRAW